MGNFKILVESTTSSNGTDHVKITLHVQIILVLDTNIIFDILMRRNVFQKGYIIKVISVNKLSLKNHNFNLQAEVSVRVPLI